MSICLGPDLPIRMAFTLRYIAVAVSVVLHAISGILLVSHTFFLSRTSPKPSFQSILAVVLQHFFPSLKELPPSFYFDHTPDSVDFSHQYRPRHRDSACSTHNTISGSASDDRSGPHLSISEPDKGYLHGHCASLQASQARARAARDPLFTLSSSLWTLKEYPTPYLLQGGDEHGSTNVPPDRLYDSPSIASSELSTPPQEERFSKSRKSSKSKRSRSGHGHSFRLLPFHKRGSRSLSPSTPGQSSHRSSLHHFPEAANLSRRSSSGSDQDHRRSSILDHGVSVSPFALISDGSLSHDSAEGRAWAQVQ